MKLSHSGVLFVMFVVAAGLTLPEFAAAQFFRPPVPGVARDSGPVVAPRRRAAVVRTPVVLHPGRVVRRAPRAVVVRPPRSVVRPFVPARVFLAPVVFSGAIVSARSGRSYRRDDDRGRYGYSRDSLVWQDTETLYREDEWTEFTLDCNARGSKLWFEVLEGRVQVDWAEIVFENGEVQVVEFPERSMGRGIYELLDFREGRRVDYVRMVAQTSSREARLTLWLER